MIFLKGACLVLDQLVASTLEKIPSCQICQALGIWISLLRFWTCRRFHCRGGPPRNAVGFFPLGLLPGWDQVKGGLDLLASLSPWWWAGTSPIWAWPTWAGRTGLPEGKSCQSNFSQEPQLTLWRGVAPYWSLRMVKGPLKFVHLILHLFFVVVT